MILRYQVRLDMFLKRKCVKLDLRSNFFLNFNSSDLLFRGQILYEAQNHQTCLVSGIRRFETQKYQDIRS